MGCGCGSRAQATGFGASQATQQSVQPEPTSDWQDPRLVPANGVMAPAGAGSGATQSFTLQTADGRTQTFGSRLEAQAERVRAGGGTIQPA
jgi:hypothetical protein